MKLIQKMSIEYAPGQGDQWEFASSHVREAYIAGFRAAREMAKLIPIRVCVEHKQIFNRPPIVNEMTDKISQLGEEEVG